MSILNRATLKGFFKSGSMPTEGNFHALIDSMYNKLDDDLATNKPIENSGSPVNSSILSSIYSIANEGLKVKEKTTDNALMHITSEGNVGIGTVASLYKLQVNGTIAAPSRKGTYSDNSCDPEKVFADGNWYPIITNLDGLNAFEIVASIKGIPGQGNYALLHATALSTYGNSKNKIIQNAARFKGLFHNIELKWTGTINNYALEIRSRCHFGDEVKIKYNITQLISD